MFNSEEFINSFVEAAKANDEAKMAEMAKSIADENLEFRLNLLSDLVDALRDSQANEVIEAGLSARLQLMKLAKEAAESQQGDNQNSAVEEAKEDTKAEEATQDVAAEDSAEEAKTEESEASEEGEAPAKEEEAEKSEEK